MTRKTVEDFLYAESELLDGHEYSAWLELFDDDGIYWIPAGDGDASAAEVAIVYDTRERLAERVWRLESGLAFGQEPRSRTVHVIGNVRVLREEQDVVDAAAAFTMIEWRTDVQRVYGGQLRYTLRRRDEQLVIACKRVELVNRDAPLGNLSVVL